MDLSSFGGKNNEEVANIDIQLHFKTLCRLCVFDSKSWKVLMDSEADNIIFQYDLLCLKTFLERFFIKDMDEPS